MKLLRREPALLALLAVIPLGGCVPALEPPNLVDNPTQDFDGDGLTEADGDCDDDDASTFPGGTEVCGDGVENDCDGAPGPCGFSGLFFLADAQGWVHGNEVGDRFGAAIAAGSSVLTTATEEIAVGAPGAQKARGTIIVFTTAIRGAQGAKAEDEELGHVVSEAWDKDDELGATLAFPGDLNGDGHPDMAAGVPGFNGEGAWQAILGPDLTVYAPLLRGKDVPRFGSTMCALGEQDGVEGTDEIAVGTGEGRFMSWGNATAPVGTLRTTDEDLGSACAGADLDGDGLSELLVGAPGAEDGAGKVCVVPGGTAGDITSKDLDCWTGAPGEGAGAAIAVVDGAVVVGAPAGERVWVVDGAAAPGPLDLGVHLDGEEGWQSGATLLAPGDVDGDGAADLVVGTPGRNEGAGGFCLVDRPAADGLLGDGACGLGELPGDRAGAALAAPGDMDGDGIADLIVGAPGWSDSTGAIYLLLGGSP